MTAAATLLNDLVRDALKKGADSADAILVDSTSLSVTYRMEKLESLERSESGDLGLRVFVGKKQAMVSATDRKPSTLKELAERAVAMAKAAPEDTYAGIADPSQIAKNWQQLELADKGAPSAEKLIEQAKEAEDAARSVKGVTNSEGAAVRTGESTVTLAASNGFNGQYRRTGYHIYTSVIAGEGTGMVTDYDYEDRVFAEDLPSAASIGRKAAERTVVRLNPRKMPTGQVPVVFAPRMSGGLIGNLAGAISGSSVARGTSFLKDKLGQQIFAANVNIIDDPFRARGLRSRPFDAEGLMPERRKIIDNGVLTTWLMDLRSARQLKMQSTGHASRGTGGPPHPSASNFYMEPGKLSPEELIKDIKQGFYVTELMGMGINGVTGDYSQAAAGFWIENGTIQFPVSEMTIASNMKDMFLNLIAANDLQFLHGVDAPTLRIEGMTVAGV
ncbi:MAG TPA: TldD/PmbA family protein [Alphaproteobacteria bacterium]|nr:TldD/PmbA family protein [Alphaproteobacteria bacterium]